jgi:hypothetical protein
MGLVATGQITIVDTNDARTVEAFITVDPGLQQIFSKDEQSVSYIPDWTAINGGLGLLLTARVFLAGNPPTEITNLLTNRKWSTDRSTAITGTGATVNSNASLTSILGGGGGGTRTYTADHSTTSTLRIKANIEETNIGGEIYFTGDYTDPATSLITPVFARVSLNVLKTGTNAVFVQTRGQTAIEQATGQTANVIAVAVDLVRAAGVDTTGVTYRFFDNGGSTQIITGAPFNTKYGLKSSAAGANPPALVGDIGTNLPAANAFHNQNCLVMNETAVTDIGVFRAEARDNDGTVYQTFFTIYDFSDPYEVRVISSTGDKLQNGQGSTVLTPLVYYGAAPITTLTGYTFKWTFYNRDGLRAAFIDTTRTAVAAGRAITANTIGSAAVITYGGTAITFAAGNIIKVVPTSGVERYYEVASGTGNTVTLRAPTTNAWLGSSYAAPAVANDMVGGALFVCVTAGGADGGRITTTGASPTITLTGFDIDVKGNVTCEASKPL